MSKKDVVKLVLTVAKYVITALLGYVGGEMIF